jgi:hypothetical protein
MSRLLTTATLLSALFVSSAALAQPHQSPSNDGNCDQATETCQFIIFKGLEVAGELKTPTGGSILSRQSASFARNAQLKRSFSPELESSLADSALDP